MPASEVQVQAGAGQHRECRRPVGGRNDVRLAVHFRQPAAAGLQPDGGAVVHTVNESVGTTDCD